MYVQGNSAVRVTTKDQIIGQTIASVVLTARPSPQPNNIIPPPVPDWMANVTEIAGELNFTAQSTGAAKGRVWVRLYVEQDGKAARNVDYPIESKFEWTAPSPPDHVDKIKFDFTVTDAELRSTQYRLCMMAALDANSNNTYIITTRVMEFHLV